MIEYRMRLMKKLPHLLAALTLLACLLLALTIARAPNPSINLDYGATTISLSADRAWTLLPGDCATISWDMHGIQSLYIDGAGKIGAGEVAHCQGLRASSPQFDITAQNGVFRSLSLPIPHLPDLLFYVAGFVGLLGAALLAVYFFVVFDLNRPLPLATFAIVALLLAIVGGWLRLNTVSPPPLIDEGDGDAHVRFWASRDRTLFPHQCLDVGWSLAGARATRLNGKTISKDPRTAKSKHCAEDGHEAVLEIRTDAGETATYQLPIPSLFPQTHAQPLYMYLSLLALLVTALICAPLIWRMLRARRRPVSRADIVAATGCCLVVLALYLPFDMRSPPQLEYWVIRNYHHGGDPHYFGIEYVSRPFATAPFALATLLDPESFLGLHITHMLVHAGRLLAFYCILRQLSAAPLYAFLTAILFMVYPVNDMMLSARSLLPNAILLMLLAATGFMLAFMRKPRRLALAGIWLMLLLNVFAFEAAFALIAAVPLLWLWRSGWTPRKFNLTAIWMLPPLAKLAWFALLIANNHEFYNSGLLSEGRGSEAAGLANLGAIFETLLGIYPHNFISGWRDALASMAQTHWLPLTALMLALAGGIAWVLAREEPPAPTTRQLVLSLGCGVMLMAAAAGVMIWLPYYRGDMWRLHQYVPLGASIVIICAALLLTARIRRAQIRNTVVIAICLLLMLPATSRLLRQHNAHIDSANAKARILRQILELVPAPRPDTHIVLVTDLTPPELTDMQVVELIRMDTLDVALQVLYGKSHAPQLAYVCLQRPYCSLFTGDDTIYTAAADGGLLQRTLLLRLNADLSVALIEDLAAYLALDADIDYDAGRLFDKDAPLPPRADSMLGAAS